MRLILFLYNIERNCCLNDRLQCRADSDCSPRSLSRQAESRSSTSDAMILTLVRKSDSKSILLVIVAQVATTIVATNTSFAHQHPSVFSNAEETWESISLAKFRFLRQCSVSLVLLLIAWLCAHPSCVVAVYLWAEESSCLPWEIERRFLLQYCHPARFVLTTIIIAVKVVSVSDIVITHTHLQYHIPSCLWSLEGHCHSIHIYVYDRRL